MRSGVFEGTNFGDADSPFDNPATAGGLKDGAMRALSLMTIPALAVVTGCSGETQAQAGESVQTEASADTAAAATEPANAEDEIQPKPEITLQSPVQVD